MQNILFFIFTTELFLLKKLFLDKAGTEYISIREKALLWIENGFFVVKYVFSVHYINDQRDLQKMLPKEMT